MSNIFSGIEISASGMTAERARMDVIAENLANANTTRAADGGPYRRKAVVLAEQPLSFSGVLAKAQSSQAAAGNAKSAGGGVQVAQIAADGAPGRRVHDPTHPDADADGFVTLPNVNPVTEMVDLIASQRAFEANATALSTHKQMFTKAFEVLR